MPNKQGSRVAASQARAKSAAKKKAHSTGPDLAAAAQAPGATDPLAQEQEEGSAVAVVEASGAELEAAAPASTPAPRRTGRAASRRERQALTVMSAGSLRREIVMIGSVTALMGITLAVIKLVTDLGR
jgi:hypothetical protein